MTKNTKIIRIASAVQCSKWPQNERRRKLSRIRHRVARLPKTHMILEVKPEVT